MSSTVPDDAPKPRLAHVRKWSDFNGYGFNLHAEKGKAGQYIGKVDPGSPAEFAGLKEGDRIVEVNGTNISNENHQQVVQRVKAVPDETKLLVIDAEAEEYYKTLKIVVRGDMPNVQVFTAPERNPTSEIADAIENNISDNIEENDDASKRSESPTPSPEEPVVTPQLEDHPYQARLCILKIWPDFQGYGFNLHAEKNKPGQFIGKVDQGSPAEAAGLLESDRIMEVNGQNVTGENHQFVVSAIKSVPNTTRMLVLSPEADEYFKARDITISSDSPFIERIECPDSKPTGNAVVSAPVEESHPFKARLIQLNTWSDYNGYGFNMHSIKGKEGEFIGKVEPGSPAFVAGLKEGDRVIEVGGSNIESVSHHDVVQKIKEASGRARLLVVDAETDAYFRGKDIRVYGSMSAVAVLSCPERKPEANGTSEQPTTQEEEPPNSPVDEPEPVQNDLGDYENVEPPSPTSDIQNNNEDKEAVIEVSEYEAPYQPDPEPEPVPSYEPEREPSPEPEINAQAQPAKEPVVTSAAPAAAPAPTPAPANKTPVVVAGIQFAGSVEEARKRMSGKKKGVRATSSSLSAKEKFDLFQRL